MRHLIAIAKKAFGDDHILFTTDPPPLVQQGSLRGSELLTCARCPCSTPSCPPRSVHSM